MAQNHMNQQAFQDHSKRHFVEGNQVFLRLQTYNHTSLKDAQYHKLVPKFYSPYKVLKHVGSMAYQLSLPSQSKIHLVFHVSFLNKVIGTNCQTQTSLPELDEEGSIWLWPQALLA
jgi:hypothetical protein